MEFFFFVNKQYNKSKNSLKLLAEPSHRELEAVSVANVKVLITMTFFALFSIN